jgi:hypothetical protein
MVSAFDLSLTKPEWALGYRFDLSCAAATRRRWNVTWRTHTVPNRRAFLHIGFRTGLAPLPDAQPAPASRFAGNSSMAPGRNSRWGVGVGGIRIWRKCSARFTRDGGAFEITTIKAPHVAVRILGRGIQLPYVPGLYFEDDATMPMIRS